MGLEVEDDLEVRARVAGTDGMLIWCDEKIGEVDGVSQYTVAGTLHHRPQPPSTVVPILLQHIAMRRIPQFTRQLHGLDSVSYWAARREMIRWLYVQDCVFLIRNRESTFCLVSDATSVTENSSALHITAATATTACYSLACRLTQSHQAQSKSFCDTLRRALHHFQQLGILITDPTPPLLSTCTITSALSDRGGSEYRGFKLFDQDGNICLIPEPTHRVHCIASWIAKYFGLSDFLRSIVTLCFFIRGNRSFAYWLRKKHRISFRACPFKEKVTNGRFGSLAFACYVLSCPLRGIPFLRWVLTFLQRNKRLIKYSHLDITHFFH